MHAEQAIMRSAPANDVSLCQHQTVSCVRCCLPHIGGDSHIAADGAYAGPRALAMKFKNFNPLKDPRIEASQYEDTFPDVGREEMERRFAERRRLFLKLYDRDRPRQSLPIYMEAAQSHEGYRYRHTAYSGPGSQYIQGSVSADLRKGELPECQLLGFVDAGKRVGCMAHPFAETSRGFDGRDLVGFFHHSGCCDSVGCEASKEFRYLSPSALKVFDKAVDGMSWYEFSRHVTSVLVYYLRGYDHLLQMLDARRILDALAVERLVRFTNTLYEDWPLKHLSGNEALFPESGSVPMNTLEILSAGIPLAERILYIALDTRFLEERFAEQLREARTHLEHAVEMLAGSSNK